ncbi:chromosome-associated kinesin KIF4 [Trichonephila inaurata madagascariensis]|uniref:Chromosome-associated kinesin KIF4 n=1 Tax=Trichonephila inaurata madagascariensis TaxID=2747483 RepID=A0A8X6WX33_9ARAC|nr:chromosome-associated kinesin KIF4 [Trichonephila inaurata madagascariensis]
MTIFGGALATSAKEKRGAPPEKQRCLSNVQQQEFLNTFSECLYFLREKRNIHLKFHQFCLEAMRPLDRSTLETLQDVFEIENVLEIPVKSSIEALDVLTKGISARKGTTKFAKKLRSPRAHLLYTLTIEAREKNVPVRVSKLHFVEIGTAERVSAPEAHRQKRAGEKPLQGLLTFNKIITNLSLKKKILPYRESKLTSILKETLGGNCITVLIACVSNVYGKTEGSIEPIRISSTARKIVNNPTINALNSQDQRRFLEREAANNARRLEAQKNAQKKKNKGDEAIAGPSSSRDTTYSSIPEELDIGYLSVPSTSSQFSFTEELSIPEQLECEYAVEDEDYEPEIPEGTIILLR